MGILLKGLSLKAIPDGEYMVVRIWNNGSISTVSCSYGVNHGEKRAVEVPTPHGRLIDADAFDNHVREAGGMVEEDLTADFKDGVQATLWILNQAPTVIEAEEGGLNERR